MSNKRGRNWWKDYTTAVVDGESYIYSDYEDMVIANEKARREAEIDRQQREIQEYYKEQLELKRKKEGRGPM